MAMAHFADKAAILNSIVLNIYYGMFWGQMGTSAICIFGTHSMNFPSFSHLYRQTEFDRPRVS